MKNHTWCAKLKSNLSADQRHRKVSFKSQSSKTNVLPVNWIWLGAKKEEDELVWLDGTKIKQGESYTNWINGKFQPYFNYGGVAMQTEHGKWVNENPIQIRWAIVCEKPLESEGEEEKKEESDQKLVEQIAQLNQKLDLIGKQLLKQSATFNSKLKVLGNEMDMRLSKMEKDLKADRQSNSKYRLENGHKLDKIFRKLEL